MQKPVNYTQQLADFFGSWRALSQFIPLEERLQNFFSQLKDVLPVKKDRSPQKEVSGKNLNTEKMNRFFEEFTQPIALAKRAGFFCDPWTVAKLKRDEVRNSSVLAWWLDPKETHGLNDALHHGLDSLLSHLLRAIESKKQIGLPNFPGPHCRVRVESCPDGDRASRVDIEIDDPKSSNSPGFFLIIEVKIDAPESKDQLERYCKVAMKRKDNRQWAILFLTPQGRNSQYINEGPCTELNKERIVTFSWKEISVILKAVAKQHTEHFQDNKFPELALVNLLARSFCNHILQF